MMITRLSLELAWALSGAPPATVSVDLQEYIDLIERSREVQNEVPSGHFAVINHADYVVEIPSAQSSVAKVAVRMSVQNFADQPKWLWLFGDAWTFGLAQVGKNPANLVHAEDATWVLTPKGRSEFTLGAFVHALPAGDEHSPTFLLDLPLAGSQRIRIRTPKLDGEEFAISGGQIVAEKEVGNVREIEVMPQTGDILKVQARPKLESVAALPPLLEVEQSHVLIAGERYSQLTTSAHARVRFSGLDEMKFQVPNHWRVLDVSGPDIRRWHQEGQVLVLSLAQPLLGQARYSIVSQGPAAAPKVAFQTKLIEPIGAAHVTGWVGVASEPVFELAESSLSPTLSRIDIRGLPEELRNQSKRPLALAYRYFDSDAEVNLQFRQLESVDLVVTLADRVDATSVLTREGRQLTVVRYQIRNNRKEYLEVELPGGARLWSATVAEQAVRPSTSSKGKLLIPLLRSQVEDGAVAGFRVEVAYVEDRPALHKGWRQTWRAALPKIDVAATYAAWKVYFPDEVKVNRRKTGGTLEWVEALSRGVEQLESMELGSDEAQEQVEEQSQVALRDNATKGDVPIAVNLPAAGNAHLFERILPASDPLELAIRYRIRRR